MRELLVISLLVGEGGTSDLRAALPLVTYLELTTIAVNCETSRNVSNTWPYINTIPIA